MNYDEFSKISDIPKNILVKLFVEGLLDESLSEANVQCLRFLEKVWNNKVICRAWIRKYLSRKNKKERWIFFATVDLESRWERYAFTRFLNQNQSGRRIRMANVIEEIREYYGLELNHFQQRRLYAIRERVYNLRKKVIGKTAET